MSILQLHKTTLAKCLTQLVLTKCPPPCLGVLSQVNHLSGGATSIPQQGILSGKSRGSSRLLISRSLSVRSYPCAKENHCASLQTCCLLTCVSLVLDSYPSPEQLSHGKGFKIFSLMYRLAPTLLAYHKEPWPVLPLGFGSTGCELPFLVFFSFL